MTEESSSNPPLSPEPVLAFVQVWAASVAQVLSQIAGSPFAVECLNEVPPDAPGPADGDAHAIVFTAGALRGEMGLRLPRSAALGVAQLVLGETQAPAAEFEPEYREAAEQWLRQVAGHVANALKPRWGEVQLRVETGTPPSWPPGEVGWLGSLSDAPCRLWIEWQLSAALQAALTAVASVPPEKSDVPKGLVDSSQENRQIVEGNLDLLMDVELEVMLRFGERSMALREILELGAGSVVELDREIDDPADLLLDGKLIARGEVVVVDGNYGLRILELLPAQLAS